MYSPIITELTPMAHRGKALHKGKKKNHLMRKKKNPTKLNTVPYVH